MNETTTDVLDPRPDIATLDGDRADALGSVLAAEAAADATTTAHRSTARRVIGGAVAAAVLAGGLLIANGVVGGPGPASVDAALAIEHVDGWTTITIRDPQASPGQIESELEAAGIDARVEELKAVNGVLQLPGVEVKESEQPIAEDQGDGELGAYGPNLVSVVSFRGAAAPGELIGMSAEFDPAAAGIPAIPTSADGFDEWTAAYHEGIQRAGIRLDDDAEGAPVGHSTVSIRDGADVDLVLYAKP